MTITKEKLARIEEIDPTLEVLRGEKWFKNPLIEWDKYQIQLFDYISEMRSKILEEVVEIINEPPKKYPL